MKIKKHFPLSATLVLVVYSSATCLAAGKSPSSTTSPAAADWPTVQRLLRECAGVYTDLPQDVVTSSYTGGPILGNGEIGATLGGTPDCQTLYLNRLDNWGRALGGLSITADKGNDTPSYRYEQDIERAEVRAQVTINGNPTALTCFVAPNVPLAIIRLVNRSARTVRYTLSPWTKEDKAGIVSLFSYGTTSADTFSRAVYDNGRIVALGPDTSDRRCWKMEPAEKDVFFIRNAFTGNYMVAKEGDVSIHCLAVDPAHTPGAKWSARKIPHGTEYENLLTRQVIIGEANASRIKLGKSPLPKSRASLWLANPVNRMFAPSQVGASDGVSWAWRDQCGHFSGNPKFAARATIACRAVDAQAEFKGSLQHVTVSPQASVTIAVAVDGKGGQATEIQYVEFYCKQAAERVRKQTPQSLAKISDQRLRWWREFWTRSQVDLGDPLLNRYWYGAYYALGCCSRAGNPCPGLWGAWINTDVPGWGGNYYCNYNFQSPFYGVFSGNHSELAEPYFDAALAALPRAAGQTQAAGYHGVVVRRSWGLPLLSTPVPAAREPAPERKRARVPNDQLDSTMFNAMNFIDHYQTTFDRSFLDKKLQPMILACVDFFDEYLVREPLPGQPGKYRYVLPESGAREGTPNDLNAAYHLGFLRRVYQTALEMSRTLDRHAERRAKWQDILTHLSVYPTTKWNGKTVIKECENRDCILMRGPGDNCSIFQFVHPGNQVGMDSPPELRKACANTLAYANSKNDASWRQMNNFAFLFSIAARLPVHKEYLYQTLRDRIEKLMRPNQTVFQGGGGIETSGATEAINAMLLQSYEGVLRFFPSWPKDKDACFRHLRARGAFLVSAELKAGEVGGVRILSEKGRDCTVANPWPGKTIVLVRDGGGREMLTGDRVIFKTAKGETVGLQPSGSIGIQRFTITSQRLTTNVP
jgi:hypothetical protein